MSYLLTINTPTIIEDVVIDWFLEQEEINEFSSMIIRGHGSAEENMSLPEKVTGKTKRVSFQFHLNELTVKTFLNKIKYKFAGSDIHYMITPIIETGDLSTYDKT